MELGLVKHGRVIVACGLAALAGWAWSGPLWLVPVVPLVGVLWLRCATRRAAACVALVYYAVSLRCVLATAPGYFGLSGAHAAGLWLGWSLLLTLPWWALWAGPGSRGPIPSLARLGAVYVLLVLPGLGWFAVAHPLSAAGLWFPGMGFAGIGLLWLVTGLSTTRPGLCAVGVLVAVAAVTAEEPAAPEGWAPARTAWKVFGLEEFGKQYAAAQLSLQAMDRRAPVNVLPEGAGGLWSRTASRLWRSNLRDEPTAVVLSAASPVYEGPDRGRYDKVVFVLGQTAIYRQRVPMPLAEWAPWRGQDARPHWWGSGVLPVAGLRAGVLLCYEQVLLGPALMSAAEGVDAWVGLSNLGWFASPTVERSQRNALSAYGLLFGVPVAHAVNERG